MNLISRMNWSKVDGLDGADQMDWIRADGLEQIEWIEADRIDLSPGVKLWDNVWNICLRNRFHGDTATVSIRLLYQHGSCLCFLFVESRTQN